MVRKILLAEDSITIQKVFELTLAKSDVALTMVDNGEDALRLSREISPNLVVADHALAGRDGFQIASELGASDKTRSIPVLILAGSMTPFDEAKFKESGAQGVLFKPFESQQLVDKVEELLRNAGEAHPPEAAGSEKEEAPAGGGEPWDFSDVLEEVDVESSGKRVTPAEGLIPGPSVPLDKDEMALGEFDVSLQEVVDESRAGEPARKTESPEREEPPTVLLGEPTEEVHLLEDLDSPPAVTSIPPPDFSPLTLVEDTEGIEDLMQVVETVVKGLPAEAPAGEESAPARPGRTSPPRPAEPPPIPADSARGAGKAPAAAEKPPAPVEKTSPAAAERRPPVDAAKPSSAAGMSESLPEELRNEFSARAEEIFRRVAAETVEKVMWEWMDRFSRDLSDKVRESAEAVAWEVIPATAEKLIREEIARIRALADQKSS